MSSTTQASPFEAVDEHRSSSSPAIWLVAWRGKWLLVLGLVVGLVLGALYFVQLTPVYQSTIKILVVKKQPEALPLPEGTDSRFSYMENYLATHQVLIRSPVIVTAAVQKGNLKTLSSLAGSEDVTGDIIRALNATREATEGGATNILNLSFRSHVPGDCPKVLEAVVEAYKEFLDSTYRNVREDSLKLINEAREILENRLTTKEDEYRRFSVALPVLWRGKDGLNVHHERIINIESKRSALLFRKVEIEEQLAKLENAMKSGQGRAQLLAMVSGATTKQPLASQEDTLAPLLLQEQMLLEDFGPDHHQVVSLRKRIDFFRKNKPNQGKVDEPTDPVQEHRQALMQELEGLKTSEQALSRFLRQEQAEAQKLFNQEKQDDAYRKDISRGQQLFESVLKRLDEVNLLKELGGGYDARCIAPAEPGSPIASKSIPIFGVAALLGLLGGLGLAYAAAFSDRSFHSAADVRRALELPIVGHLPHFVAKVDEISTSARGEAPALAPILCAFHRPKSREAEAFRGIRTALFYGTQGKGQKLIQITSPNVGDGKSTLAANLAISIAQAEKKVILIDADFRRPVLHKLFNLSPRRGLGSILTGEAELADVILPSGIPGLSVLPCGPIPANPAELLSLPRFKEAVEDLRKLYDFVIVDSPPLLAVTDPCMVAPNMDGVLLTVRLTRHARPMAKRAKEILMTLDAKVLGVVVSGLHSNGHGYGYGYDYGYDYETDYFEQQNLAEAARQSNPEEK